MAFPFLTVFIVFVVFLAIRYRSIANRRAKRMDAYWDRQERAEHTPAKDLTNLPYIKVPLRQLPLDETEEDEELATLIGSIRELSHLPLLNLNGKDNAYLKETYGTDNFDYMTTVADNFDRLQMLLVDYAKVLMQKERINDAILILEYGVSIGSDISSNYTLLGECYQTTGQLDKIPALKEKLQQLHLLLEPSILSYLDSLENQ